MPSVYSVTFVELWSSAAWALVNAPPASTSGRALSAATVLRSMQLLLD